MRSSRRRPLVAFAAVAGAFTFGAIAVQAVTDDRPAVVGGPKLSMPADDLGTVVEMSATGGGQVIDEATGVTLDIKPTTTDGLVCARVTRPDATVEDACYSEDLLSRGLSYSVMQSHDAAAITVGIVPDRVSRVTIGDKEVLVRNNVWVHVGPPPGDEGGEFALYTSGPEPAVVYAPEVFGSSEIPPTTIKN
jgi:hypothetical protein